MLIGQVGSSAGRTKWVEIAEKLFSIILKLKHSKFKNISKKLLEIPKLSRLAGNVKIINYLP